MVPPTPTRAPQGREPRGGLVLYYKKLCVILILGFSIVGNSKMISIFILGYTQPPLGHPRGRGPREGFSPILPKIMCYINSAEFYTHQFLPPPKGRPFGGLGYPKVKIEIIFEIPTIENPRIDITHDFW